MNDLYDILIVEDEESHVELIKRALLDSDRYNVIFACNITDGKDILNKMDINLIISDWKLPDGEGIDFIPLIKRNGFAPLILMTSFGSQELAVEAMKLGAIDYVVKSPEAFSKLPFTINRALREWENIIAREKAENALRESEIRYRAFVETSKDVISQVDLDGNYLFFNKAGFEAMGMTKEEVIGKNIRELFPKHNAEIQMNALGELKKAGKIIEIQLPIWLKGVEKDYFIVMIPYWGNSGNIESAINICHDITELKKTEKALKISETKYREQTELLSNILRHIPDYVCWKDNDLTIRGCNDNFFKVLGLSSDTSVIGKTNYDLTEEKEFAERLSNDEMTVIENGQPLLDDILEYKAKNGKKYIITKKYIPLKNQDGNKAGIIVMYSDITDEKNAEEELRKLSRATEQSPALIMITDTDGNIEYVNPSFERVAGYKLEEVKGKNPRILKSGFTNPGVYKALWATLKAGNEWRGEFQNKKKNGEFYWESASITAIKNERGIITHYIAVKEDISAKKALEFELKHAVDMAEESSRLKSSLLSNMSHELRTPLNGILGLSQILIEELYDNSLSTFAKKIYMAGKRLMITLNSILDLSEIESNTTQLNFVKHEIGAHINYLLTQYVFMAKEKGLTFNVNVLSEDILAYVDERLSNQIILNIVDNAVKYTEKGGISVDVEKEKIGNEIFVKISVIDTGIGISEENIQLIFEEFRQVSEGYNRSFEGSGLGLALVKKMLKLLNGSIKVESKLGIGSKFVVYLPGVLKESELIPEVQYEESAGEDAESVKPEILLVEDNAINKEVIICYIENFCNVDGVGDGYSAIEKASAKKYDLVLMDINLGSGMDGIQATQEIKNIPGYSDVPFVALTGYAMRGDKERLLSQGLTHYLPKPFEKDELQHLVKEILNL